MLITVIYLIISNFKSYIINLLITFLYTFNELYTKYS